MRYRIAILGLAAVLGVLPALTNTGAAPLPKGAKKKPEIYALIYVGIGKNHPYNARRISDALQSIRIANVPPDRRGAGRFAFVTAREPKVKDLPIVKDKEKRLGEKGRDEWADSNTRVANLEDTAVVRVWFADGTPQEQVVLVNAIASNYVKSMQPFRGALERHELDKRTFRKRREEAGGKVTEEEEREFRLQEEVLKHLPHVIEWASLPDKP
jgi:hypothetical protein